MSDATDNAVWLFVGLICGSIEMNLFIYWQSFRTNPVRLRYVGFLAVPTVAGLAVMLSGYSASRLVQHVVGLLTGLSLGAFAILGCLFVIERVRARRKAKVTP